MTTSKSFSPRKLVIYALLFLLLAWVFYRVFAMFPSEQERRFVASAVSGDYEVMTALIDGGVDINAIDKEWTALSVAAGKGDFKMVEFLLMKGADVDGVSSAGFTPLYWASFNGRAEVVRLLLDSDADVRSADPQGHVHFIDKIAERGHASIAIRLREHIERR